MSIQIAAVDAVDERLNYSILNYMRTSMSSSVTDYSKFLFDRYDT